MGIQENSEHFMYTYQHNFLGKPGEEECFIRKDSFFPYGEVKVGTKTRGEFGFMEIIKVFNEPHIIYGKFIAKAITYEEMNADLKR